MTFEPIGVIHTPHKTRAEAPIQPRFAEGAEGRVELRPELGEALSDLDGFSHIVLLYHLHLSEGYDLKVKPYLDDTPRGLFATRAPRRPNPIGMSVVRVDRIEENMVYVRDVDMVNGTPLLDIKPYVRPFEPDTDVKLGWIDGKVRD